MAAPKSGPTAKKNIDTVQLEKLASMHCTMKEMAAFFDCSIDTLERNYAVIIENAREKGKASVRRMMWLHGEKGSTVALKYLITNVLKERIEIDSTKFGEESAQQDLAKKIDTVSTEMILQFVRNNEKAS